MTDVENIRYELGKEARAKGDQLHENASEEWRRGYSRRGFGSNVTPRNFGRNISSEPSFWLCVSCEYENRSDRVQRRGGEEVCWNCGVERKYVDIDILEGQNE